VAAQTVRANPSFDTEEAITTLKTGEALVSFLDEHGAPGVVERATILPPQSHMGAVDEEVRARVIASSPLWGIYEKADDSPSKEAQPAAQPQSQAQASDLEFFLVNGVWYARPKAK